MECGGVRVNCTRARREGRMELVKELVEIVGGAVEVECGNGSGKLVLVVGQVVIVLLRLVYAWMKL